MEKVKIKKRRQKITGKCDTVKVAVLVQMLKTGTNVIIKYNTH